jgi:serine phosphatase RsbU (regulator of sigma subunit)/predicted enzyme related to lactoylglutathione lyase
MSNSALSQGPEPSANSPDRPQLHLSLHHVTILVRDQDRSLGFYLDQLGFNLVVDARLESGDRWAAVAPPDGTAILALVTPKPDSDEFKLIGRSTDIIFVTEDVTAKFHEWREKGVHFHHPPQTPSWGGIYTRFEDPDGNSFGLAGRDEVSRQIEAKRRAVAEKLELERRTDQELEIAKQVQARLFPQTLPALRTLDYAGICIQAREVGGDYYDFLNLGRQQLGLVIGDISGKGIAAALLMAHLQANLRSQCAIAWDQPQRLLRSVNELFYENTADNAYATLFFAEYDDKLRRLRYANCGHLSALLLRRDNTLERLDSTGTVLGLFGKWDCSIAELEIFSGDTLTLYTDGITESLNSAGDEYGEQRLIEVLRRDRDFSSAALLASIVEDVRHFSPHEQHDDITLIVAKCKEDQ